MYSTHNEGKSGVAERFIRTLKNKIHTNMTSVSKNVYIDIMYSTYIYFGKKNNKEDPKFKFGDHVRLSKCKNMVSCQIGWKKFL